MPTAGLGSCSNWPLAAGASGQMVLAIQQRSRAEAFAEVTSALSVEGAPQLRTVALVAAHLRAECEAYAVREAGGVHTSRLIAAVVRDLSGLLGLQEDAARSLANEVLSSLGATGDLWRAAGGYWHATPPRSVSLPSGHAFLLGSSSVRPGTDVGQGPVRYLKSVVPQTVPTQAFDDWLGREDSIEVWMEKALRSYRTRLQPSGLPADHLQIYAPDQARDSSRPRWLDARDFEATGVTLRLCRASAKPAEIYNRPYFLGEFVRDRDGVRLLRATPVTHDHSRRFRFAFDTALTAKRFVRVSREGETVHLSIANDLPSEEAKVLALGWNAAEAPSPAVRRMVFPVRAVPFVGHAFARLGMILGGGIS